MWTYVIMGILILLIGIFVILTVLVEKKNKKARDVGILYPFSGQLPPPNPPWTVAVNKNNPGVGKTPEDGMYLVGMVGGESTNVPQIQCPVGSKINIVGAYLDIIDPYGECSNTPDNILKLTCGDPSDTTNAATCTQNSDCGAGMHCYSAKCIPKTCTTNNDCGGSSASGTTYTCETGFGTSCSTTSDCNSPSGSLKCISGTCLLNPGVASACMACVVNPSDGKKYCASEPLCQNANGGLNDTCSPSSLIGKDGYYCRPRDASAYLAAHCDGKQTCLGNPRDIWKPNDQGGVFGPLPCLISVSSTENSTYAKLPIITGWGGGTPPDATNPTNSPVTFSQGYYVHGIYTCVPDDENALTK